MVKRVLYMVLALVLFMLAGLLWYDYTYSMDVIDSKRITSDPSGPKVLVASQGSPYKHALHDAIIQRLSGEGINVDLIDVTNLDTASVDYDAFLIIHVWEAWKPPKQVPPYLNQIELSKVFTICTSGDGNYRLVTVDAITSASVLSDIPGKVDTAMAKIESILKV